MDPTGASWTPSGLSGAPAAPLQDGKMAGEKTGLLSGLRGASQAVMLYVGVGMLTACLCCEMQAPKRQGPCLFSLFPAPRLLRAHHRPSTKTW